MDRLGTAPSVVRARLPLALPPTFGVNTMLKVKLWPALSVVGTLRPLRVKPAPVRVACEICRAEPPELVSVSERVWLLPTCTLPKLRLAGFAARDPCVTPEPVNAMFRVGLDAELLIEMFPLALPLAAGAKVAVNVTL